MDKQNKSEIYRIIQNLLSGVGYKWTVLASKKVGQVIKASQFTIIYVSAKFGSNRQLFWVEVYSNSLPH